MRFFIGLPWKKSYIEATVVVIVVIMCCKTWIDQRETKEIIDDRYE
ncbi:MAG: hypothetical protein PHW22_03330 [Bacilli bacterium]|nr:hypothetical protein [Bacilli bacterium]